jgi:ribulose-phosphate 3-epimerase
MIEIIPSLLVESRQEFERRLRLVEHDCETMHVDILDGSMFGNMSWHDAQAVAAMRTNVRYELHLMVENPLPIVEDWHEHVKQTKRAIVHAEITRPFGTVIEHIRDMLKLEAGVAINPETPLEAIENVMHSIHELVVMGVHPGMSGRAFEGDYIVEKIRTARNHRPDLAIEIDGGVTAALLPRLAEAGATRICAASLIFASPDPTAALKELNERAKLLSNS